MRGRKLLVALAGLAVVVAAGLVVLWPRPIKPGLTQENFDRVRIVAPLVTVNVRSDNHAGPGG